MIFPCSWVQTLLSSSKCASSNSFSLNRWRALVSGGVLLHAGNASCAASIAALVSSAFEKGTLAIVFSVAGFTTSL